MGTGSEGFKNVKDPIDVRSHPVNLLNLRICPTLNTEVLTEREGGLKSCHPDWKGETSSNSRKIRGWSQGGVVLQIDCVLGEVECDGLKFQVGRYLRWSQFYWQKPPHFQRWIWRNGKIWNFDRDVDQLDLSCSCSRKCHCKTHRWEWLNQLHIC